MRVLLADDQAVVRSGFRLILSSDPDLEVVGEAGDGLTAVRQATALRPDVVVMDVRMPRMDGIAATSVLSQQAKAPAVLVVTTFDLDEYVFGALRAGAAGFLLKDCEPAELIEAVRTVGVGHGLVAPAVTRRLISRLASIPEPRHDPRLDTLTPRELDVLRAVARGLSNRDIARDLDVGENTVKTHVARVLAKLDLSSRAQAVVLAYESGIVRPGEGDVP